MAREIITSIRPSDGIGLGGELGAAAHRAAVAERDHEHRPVEVVDQDAVHLDAQPHDRGVPGGQGGADGIADLAEVEPGDADRPEPLLPPGAAAAGIGARADMDAVDDDLADLVDEDVEAPRPGRRG